MKNNKRDKLGYYEEKLMEMREKEEAQEEEKEAVEAERTRKTKKKAEEVDEVNNSEIVLVENAARRHLGIDEEDLTTESSNYRILKVDFHVDEEAYLGVEFAYATYSIEENEEDAEVENEEEEELADDSDLGDEEEAVEKEKRRRRESKSHESDDNLDSKSNDSETKTKKKRKTIAVKREADMNLIVVNSVDRESTAYGKLKYKGLFLLSQGCSKISSLSDRIAKSTNFIVLENW